MKPILEYLYNRKGSIKSNIFKIPGSLQWELKSKEYIPDQKFTCKDWYCVKFDDKCIGKILMFLSPNCEWIIYSSIFNEVVYWALAGMDYDILSNLRAGNLEKVYNILSTDFTSYLAKNATVPFLDEDSVFPKEVEKIAKNPL